VTLHNWFWISTFRYTGNRLPIYCNRLHHLKNNWNVRNSVKSFWNKTVTGNRLTESKNSSNLENFEKKSFEKKNYAMFVFLRNLFNTSLVKSSWFLLLNLEFIFSWILKSNFSWSCWLNLEIILTQSWSHYLGFLSSSSSSSKLLESTWFIIMKLASTELSVLNWKQRYFLF